MNEGKRQGEESRRVESKRRREKGQRGKDE